MVAASPALQAQPAAAAPAAAASVPSLDRPSKPDRAGNPDTKPELARGLALGNAHALEAKARLVDPWAAAPAAAQGIGLRANASLMWRREATDSRTRAFTSVNLRAASRV